MSNFLGCVFGLQKCARPSVLPGMISLLMISMYFFFNLCSVQGVYDFKLISEAQMIVRRKGRSCCEKLCHSDLHRESHMVVSCRITLQGVQCLTQGHVSNPAWKLRPIAQCTFCIFWLSVTFRKSSHALPHLFFLSLSLTGQSLRLASVL